MRSSAVRRDRAFRLCSALGVTAVLALLPASAVGEIVKWIDENGGSHYADGLDNVPERYRNHAAPVGLRNQPVASGTVVSPGAARESAARQTSGGGLTEIQYVPGERILVDARLNGEHTVRLLLDTGADRTLISPRALVAAGVSLTRGAVSGSIVGVTGTADVKSVVLDSLAIGDARVGRMRVLAYDMGHTGHDGLLGRDYLDQFQVTIDSSRGVVTLSPKR
jgi:predicted aspartyl protease